MDKIGCMVIEVAIGEIINRIGIQSAGVRSGSGSATLGISLAGERWALHLFNCNTGVAKSQLGF